MEPDRTLGQAVLMVLSKYSTRLRS